MSNPQPPEKHCQECEEKYGIRHYTAAIQPSATEALHSIRGGGTEQAGYVGYQAGLTAALEAIKKLREGE